MVKRCRFFVALIMFLCVFSCGIVGTASADSVTFTTSNCSQTLLQALNAAATGTASTNDLTINDIEKITRLVIKKKYRNYGLYEQYGY